MQTPLTATSDPPDHLAAAAAPTAGVVALPGGILASAAADAPLEPPFGQAPHCDVWTGHNEPGVGTTGFTWPSPPTGTRHWKKSRSTEPPAASATSWAPPTGDSGWQCALFER